MKNQHRPPRPQETTQEYSTTPQAAPGGPPPQGPDRFARLIPQLHTVSVRPLDQSETTGDPERPKYYGLFAEGRRVHEIEIKSRDVVQFEMPQGETGTITFLRAAEPVEPPFKDVGPFGFNAIEVRGRRVVASAVQPLPQGERWAFQFTIYLHGRDHVVDGASTPKIIVRDP